MTPELRLQPALILGILVFFALLFAGAPGVALVMTILLVNSVRSVEGSLQSLLGLSIVLIGNGQLIYQYSPMIVLGRWGVLIFACMNIFFRTQKFTPLTVWFLLVMGLVILNSTFFGQLPTLSLFKASIYSLGVFGLITGFQHLEDHAAFGDLLFNTFVVVVFLSGVLGVFLPDYAYLRSEYSKFNGLRGVLIHPQPHSVYLTVTTVFVLATLFDRKSLYRLSSPLVFVFLGVVLMYFTRARISILVFVGSIGISVAMALLKPSYLDKVKAFFSSWIPYVLGGAVVVVSVLYSGAIQQGVVDFIFKNGRNGYDLAESFQGSRGFLILQQVNNITANWVTGIGFGVPSTLDGLEIIRDPLFNLPIQAEVEKGMVFLAVVEENGVFVGALIFIFIFVLLRHGLNKNKMMAFAPIMAGVLVNLGEAVFFSVGGIGLYVWIMISFCLGTPVKQAEPI